jgi:hypothetical protein
MPEQIAVLLALTAGLFDKVPLEKVRGRRAGPAGRRRKDAAGRGRPAFLGRQAERCRPEGDSGPRHACAGPAPAPPGAQTRCRARTTEKKPAGDSAPAAGVAKPPEPPLPPKGRPQAIPAIPAPASPAASPSRRRPPTSPRHERRHGEPRQEDLNRRRPRGRRAGNEGAGGLKHRAIREVGPGAGRLLPDG